jgi:hypothetical protein
MGSTLKGKQKMANVNDEYKKAKIHIANILGWFECELQKEPQEIDWSHVGSLNEVRRELIQTLAFLSGFEEEQIKESLEDLTLTNKKQ